jgi:hypothetical protein
MSQTREVLWGEALQVEVNKTKKGLRGAVEVIHGAVGPTIGGRSTFAKLYDATGPDDLDPKERWRVWLLLVALSQEPSDWGIDDGCVPYMYSGVEQLKDALRLFAYDKIQDSLSTRWSRYHVPMPRLLGLAAAA